MLHVFGRWQCPFYIDNSLMSIFGNLSNNTPSIKLSEICKFKTKVVRNEPVLYFIKIYKLSGKYL